MNKFKGEIFFSLNKKQTFQRWDITFNLVLLILLDHAGYSNLLDEMHLETTDVVEGSSLLSIEQIHVININLRYQLWDTSM